MGTTGAGASSDSWTSASLTVFSGVPSVLHRPRASSLKAMKTSRSRQTAMLWGSVNGEVEPAAAKGAVPARVPSLRKSTQA